MNGLDRGSWVGVITDPFVEAVDVVVILYVRGLVRKNAGSVFFNRAIGNSWRGTLLQQLSADSLLCQDVLQNDLNNNWPHSLLDNTGADYSRRVSQVVLNT